MTRYVLTVLLAIDQLLNALLGGYADETISYRASIAAAEGRAWGCIFCKWIERWWPSHCDLEQPPKALKLSRGATWPGPLAKAQAELLDRGV
ncbi:hypothetical protein [Bradyrhizobium paxllaeri]|uniref:hypothetical protein n=1 Tax=Bradyrhizobium paxllaeri TaxID=190148 RepID=UPI000810D557|nr:hypothetical protein [Bradyrhizobium paxllaeri]